MHQSTSRRPISRTARKPLYTGQARFAADVQQEIIDESERQQARKGAIRAANYAKSLAGRPR